MVIAHAEGTIDALATAFVTECSRSPMLWERSLPWASSPLAGEVPLENIDHFADGIIEDFDRDRAAIGPERRLTPQSGGGPSNAF